MTRRKLSQLTTGRLQLLRLFSTLLPIALIEAEKGEAKAHACEKAWFRQLRI